MLLGKVAMLEGKSNNNRVGGKLGVPGELVVEGSDNLTPAVFFEVQHISSC